MPALASGCRVVFWAGGAGLGMSEGYRGAWYMRSAPGLSAREEWWCLSRGHSWACVAICWTLTLQSSAACVTGVLPRGGFAIGATRLQGRAEKRHARVCGCRLWQRFDEQALYVMILRHLRVQRTEVKGSRNKHLAAPHTTPIDRSPEEQFRGCKTVLTPVFQRPGRSGC